MSHSIHFGKPLTSAPKSFEDSLLGLAKPGIASTFRCYFPPELAFDALVQGQYSGWMEDAPSSKVQVVGFVASYVNLKKAGCSLSFEPRYAIVKKAGKTAKNHYLALYGPSATQASVVLATQRDFLAQVIATSPFQEHIENKQHALAQVLAKHYRGDVGKTPICMDAEFARNKFLEEAFRKVRLERMDAKERGQQKVLEAASIHFTHFHGDLNAKFDGLVGGPKKLRRNAAADSAARALGFTGADSVEYQRYANQMAQEEAKKQRKAELAEMVRA